MGADFLNGREVAFMSVFNGYNPHTKLNFSEANIISENRMFKDKGSFIERLSDLRANTTDPILLRELDSLAEKINHLNNAEFEQLLADAESGLLLFPANYTLPNISDISL